MAPHTTADAIQARQPRAAFCGAAPTEALVGQDVPTDPLALFFACMVHNTST
jgi:hypothetical protein